LHDAREVDVLVALKHLHDAVAHQGWLDAPLGQHPQLPVEDVLQVILQRREAVGPLVAAAAAAATTTTTTAVHPAVAAVGLHFVEDEADVVGLRQ
jgi:hypothetical protein